MKHTKFGFTLIEVLIALVIIAIAMTAIVVTLSESVRNIGRVQQKMAAHWVALNVIAELQAGVLQLPLNSVNNVTNDSTMLQSHFYWRYGRVAGINQENNLVYQRVFVDVSQDKNFNSTIEHLVGFVRLHE